MKTAAIAIDEWKLAIFEKHLAAAGYEHTQHPGLTAGTLFLKVATHNLAKLQSVIEKAQTECATQ